MASFLNLLHSGSFNIFSLGLVVTSEENTIGACYEIGLIPRVVMCPVGHGIMAKRSDGSRKLGFRWMCNLCHVRVSPIQNTFFSRVNLDFSTSFKLIALWFWRIPVSQAYKHANVNKQTAVDFYSFLREVAHTIMSHDFVQIGGPGDIVEVDESHLFKKKYGRGRNLKRAIWVFGGVSRATRKACISVIRNKSRNTLFPLMQKYIAQETFIMSDEHRSYRTCPVLGFRGHATVNHSQTYVRQRRAYISRLLPGLGVPTRLSNSRDQRLIKTKVHINTCERMWRDLKAKLRTCRTPAMVPAYIGEYLYRKNILKDYIGWGNQFERLLADIVRVYPGPGITGIKIENCDCLECI